MILAMILAMVEQKLRLFAVSLAALVAAAFVLPGEAAAAEKGLYLEGRAGAISAEDSRVCGHLP
jgi:hypothetical protein